VSRQTNETQLYKTEIHSTTCFDPHGVIIRLESKTY